VGLFIVECQFFSSLRNSNKVELAWLLLSSLTITNFLLSSSMVASFSPTLQQVCKNYTKSPSRTVFTHDERRLKGKGFPYSLQSVWPGADPGVQAASLQVIHPAVGCQYFSPGLRLPSQPQNITAPWPVPSYTA